MMWMVVVAIVTEFWLHRECIRRRSCAPLAYTSFDVEVESFEDETFAHALERKIILPR